MKLINDNLKKTGIVNSILIVIAIAIRMFDFINYPPLVKTDTIVCCLSLLFGLFYSISGYKKDNANFYMVFMLLFSLSSLINLISVIRYAFQFGIDYAMVVFAICDIIIFICTFILGLIKNIGEIKSFKLSYVVIFFAIIETIVSILDAISSCSLKHVVLVISILIESFLVFAFVSAKYADKKARGAK